MRRFIFIFSCLIGLQLLSAAPLQAAQLYSGQNLDFSPSDQLNNAYIASNSVSVNTPVGNDLVVAGASVTISKDVEHNLLAAGGTVTVNGNVGQTARIAGGTVVINGTIAQDLIVAGGEVDISSTATIKGDLVAFGGTINIQGPVEGNVIVNGSDVLINSTIGNLKDSQMSQLTLGQKAVVNGSLNYKAPQEATKSHQAIIKGSVNYQPYNPNQNSRQLLTLGFFYNLIASAIFALVLLFVFRKISLQAAHDLIATPLPLLAWGFGGLILFPVLCFLIMFLSVWLGIAGLILYLLVMFTSYFLAQLLLGYWLLRWWFGRNKETYTLDWRAAIVGVILGTILSVVPVIGWLIMAVMVVFGTGTLARQLWSLHAT
jgi:cytoskeletal protein CcmA (bactofilin family)